MQWQKFQARQILREARAGFVTFLAMSYILLVNPSIVADAMVDIPFASLVAATAIAAAFGSIAMGVLAKYPFAMAPGMGLNAYFTYTMVAAQGVPWQTALGCVFYSGLLFLIISVAGLRTFIVNAIPSGLKIATSAGIGFFIAMIGLKSAGIITGSPATMVTLGNISSPEALLCGLGLVIIAVLMHFKFRGAILVGIAAVSIAAIVAEQPVFNGQSFQGIHGGIARTPHFPSDTFFAVDFAGALDPKLLNVILLLLFIDFFDTAGTLFGLAGQSGNLNAHGKLERSKQAFTADGLATSFSALIGTSPTTTYIESATGIEEGGRTGLTAIFVGLFFLLALIFYPLAHAVPAAATAPALIIVGSLMMRSMKDIQWYKVSEGLPAFVLIILMPLTFSIAHGIAFGIILYALIDLLRGNFKNWLLSFLALLLVARYLFLPLH